MSFTLWDASASADGRWLGGDGPEELSSARKETGLQATGSWRNASKTALAGVRVVSADARYAAGEIALESRRPVTTLFGDVGTALTADLRLGLSSAATVLSGRVLVAPSATLAWHPSAAWSWSASATRTHQLTQSLRNPESVVGGIFPANPGVAAGSDGIPVPSADQLTLRMTWRPAGSTQLELQGWLRRSRDVLLNASSETGPFSSALLLPSTLVGHSTVDGLSLGASTAGSRLAWNGLWVWTRARDTAGGHSWTPSRSPRHRIDGGVIAYPSPTTSLRFGLFAVLGRSGTDIGPGLEWEACNLLDRGCEFAGAPRTSGAPGGRRLSPYLRADVGIRKHWHVALGGRSSTLAAHATLSNVFANDNTLVWVVGEGSAEPVPMRPFSPLVFGLDWQF